VVQRSDDELLGATPRDPAAFGELYRRHVQALAGYFVRRTGNAEMAADLTAETFARALRHARRYDAEKGPAVGWLYGGFTDRRRTAGLLSRVNPDARRGDPNLIVFGARRAERPRARAAYGRGRAHCPRRGERPHRRCRPLGGAGADDRRDPVREAGSV